MLTAEQRLATMMDITWENFFGLVEDFIMIALHFRFKTDEWGTPPRQLHQVFVMSADGGEAKPLTDFPSENGHPAWSRGRAVKP